MRDSFGRVLLRKRRKEADGAFTPERGAAAGDSLCLGTASAIAGTGCLDAGAEKRLKYSNSILFGAVVRLCGSPGVISETEALQTGICGFFFLLFCGLFGAESCFFGAIPVFSGFESGMREHFVSCPIVTNFAIPELYNIPIIGTGYRERARIFGPTGGNTGKMSARISVKKQGKRGAYGGYSEKRKKRQRCRYGTAVS